MALCPQKTQVLFGVATTRNALGTEQARKRASPVRAARHRGSARRRPRVHSATRESEHGGPGQRSACRAAGHAEARERYSCREGARMRRSWHHQPPASALYTTTLPLYFTAGLSSHYRACVLLAVLRGATFMGPGCASTLRNPLSTGLSSRASGLHRTQDTTNDRPTTVHGVWRRFRAWREWSSQCKCRGAQHV